MMGSQGYFVELNKQERLSKLSLLSRQNVLIWLPNQNSKNTEYSVDVKTECLFSKESPSFLELATKLEGVDYNAKYLVRFEVGQVVYFGTGMWQEEMGTNSDYPFLFELGENLYRYEKREGDRLLTYPHRNVYIEFNVPYEQEQISENIISFDQSQKKLLRLYTELNKNEVTGTLRFRVIDISAKGLAFIVGSKEITLFKEHSVEQVELKFNSQRYDLKVEELLYEVEYLDTFSKRRSLKKVGIKYSSDPRLQKEIEKLLGGDVLGRINIKDDFENFLLNQ